MKSKMTIDVRQIFDMTKNLTQTNIINAVANGSIKIERQQLDQLVSLIGASIDQAFFQGHGPLLDKFERLMAEESRHVSVKKK